MPSKRAMKAAEEIYKEVRCHGMPLAYEDREHAFSLWGEMIDHAAEIPALEADLTHLRARNKYLDAELEWRIEERPKLEARVAELEARVAELEAALSAECLITQAAIRALPLEGDDAE